MAENQFQFTGIRLRDLNFLAEAINAELYGEKEGLPWRLAVGQPLGLALLDETGLIPEDNTQPAPKGGKDVASVVRRMADGGAVKIVCIGDSITWGQLDSGGQAAIPYPLRLQNLLREYYGNIGITVVNKGVAGSTVQDMLARFTTDVTNEAPDLVIFNGGQNDCRPPNEISVDEYSADVDAYLKRCKPTPIMILGITPRSFENLGSNVVGFYRDALRSVAASRNLPYIDANMRMENIYKARAYGRGRISSDGAHLSLEGYRLLGDVVFCDALVNEDLYVKPGQFKDVSGQWVFEKTGAYLLAGINHQDSKTLTLGTDGNGGTARLYLFMDDWEECDLVMHATINCITPGQLVRVDNISTGSEVDLPLSPNLAGGAAWYCLDYPVTALRLRPGLNNILLSSVANSQWAINGFSVAPRRSPVDRGGYLATFNEADNTNQVRGFFGAATYASGGLNGFEVLRNGPLIVTAGTKIAPLFDLIPCSVLDFLPRWRLRATVFPGTAFHFGQQSNNNADYMPVFSLTLDGTDAILKCRDAFNVQRTLASVPLAVTAAGLDIKLDLNQSLTGWGLHVNGTLVYTETVPLSRGRFLVQSSAAYGVFCNPPILRLEGAGNADVLRGESWISFTDDKLHLIGAGNVNKTVAFA